ncbi:DUF4906 domain-containing protein [Parabacteroides sp. AM08-6]|uniref:DUF4906 domain-containing protein n=1 Tax=Parabacteroides sp. AM08-6 TaxID=2292053 RepID=UPI000EFF7146|nr:DUF4906 domain-containing protein [Parabacteroides sp. AM08-6]RHJ86439.1 DUF4906 domain-containing protein [Parabacteroides sp. AM08-6]
MKVKNNIYKLFLFGWITALAVSCTDDYIDRKGEGAVKEGLPVILTLNLSTPDAPVVETKAIDDGKTFGEINSVSILSYNDKGEDLVVSCPDYAAGSPMKFETRTGVRRTYVLVNSAYSKSELESNFQKESDFLANYGDISVSDPLLPTGDEAMIGYLVEGNDFAKSSNYYQTNYSENTPADRQPVKAPGLTVTDNSTVSYCASVYPPYSHVTFKINNQCINKELENDYKITVVIDTILVRNVPTKYSLFPKAWSNDEVVADAKLVRSMNELSLDGTEFYLYENAQGVNSSVFEGQQDLKRPIGTAAPTGGNGYTLNEWEKLWQGNSCTYIEVSGKYALGKKDAAATINDKKTVGTIKYRFFLGENNYSSLDVKRNTKYIVSLNLSNKAGSDEIVAEWRVGADLHEIGFSYRTVVMDGEQKKYYPFSVINNSGAEVKIDVPTVGESPFMIVPWDGSEWSENYESGSLSGVSNVGYKDFGIFTSELAVAGAALSGQGQSRFKYHQEGENDVPLTSVSVNLLPTEYSNSHFDHIREGSVYREQVNRAVGYIGSGRDKKEIEYDRLVIRQFPLLLVPISGVDAKKGPYVERIEEKEIVNYSELDNFCLKANGNSSGTYTWRLPTSAEFKIMIDDKYKDLMFPLHSGYYWIMDGTTYKLINTQGDEISSSLSNMQGHVRCIMKMDNNGKLE